MISPQCSHLSHSPSVFTLRSPSSVLSDVFSRVNQAIQVQCGTAEPDGAQRPPPLRAPQHVGLPAIVARHICTSSYNTPVIPFRLTFRPGVSLYEQVVYAAKRAVVSRKMRPGEPFPSVRALSKEFKINPNTAHKVVAQLIAEGLLEVRVGVGTVVAAPRPSTAAARAQLLKGE